MRSRKTSIRDVAARAGVSTATVSNVLSGRKPVNADLCERVLEAARALGYQRNRAASSLRSGRSSVVAVLVPDLTDTFFAAIVSSIEALGHDQGYDVIVASSRDNRRIEESRLAAMLEWHPAGVIAIPCSNTVPESLVQQHQDMPVVLVDRVIASEAPTDTVTLDNADSGEIAARHLVERGHRNILLAATRMDIAAISERVGGASELIVRQTGCAPTVLELTSSLARGTEILSSWLERHPLPDAVLALNNVTTLSALSALAGQRIAIPDRVSLMAFDDYPWMSARRTGLSAVDQPVEAMARAAWDRLLLRMQRRQTTAPRSIVFNARLVVRDSVKELEGKKPVRGSTGVPLAVKSSQPEKTGQPRADDDISVH
ncbi:MAG: LacI family DNA-binding transcriptional regulator [Salinisphaera sp.]|jgi:LacI family transcriptional regulator|nr:LacI family DNA-binding transcriptional regulator [Salinisphaera sp.]